METLTIETKPNLHVGDLISTRDVMSLFGVTRRTIENWKHRGVLKPIKVAGVVRYRRDEINALAQ
jgi:DNA-binding transcriptional MerR regulator